ncbi:unnamed protein product [Closterium sp. NIES-53]
MDIFPLDYDAILTAMHALTIGTEGDCSLYVLPDLGIEATALGASESALPGTASAEALHTFTLDSGASRCFFRDSTTLTPLSSPVPVRLADPSGGPVLAHSSTVLPCSAVPSGSLSGLHLPSFSTNLVFASGQVAPPCLCPLLLHQTLMSLPLLPPSPAPPCLPCIEGRQRATPHSSSFPPTSAPLQTLHMDVWGPARVSGQGRERYFLLVVDDYTWYTTVFPLRSKGEDLPILRLHSDRGGEFSSDLLRDLCHGEGILQSFTLPASPQQNGIAERRIGLVMEVACTSVIHVTAPHFLWPFAVRYAAHQLNIWPHISLQETSPTFRWTGKVGDASVFRVWGSRDFVLDMFVEKLSTRAIPSDVTFDESVPFYRLFPYRFAPPPPPPLFLARGPPPVDPLPPQGPAPSGAARGAVSGGAEPGGAESKGAGSGGAEARGVEPGGAEPTGVEFGDAEPEGVEPGGAESGGAKPRGATSSGGPAGASPRQSPRQEPLSLHQLREWFTQRTRLRSGATGAGDSVAGDTGAGGAGVTAGAGGTRGAAGTGPGGARTRGTGAAGNGSVGGAEAGDTGAGGPSAIGARAAGAGAVGARAGGTGAVDLGGGGAGAGGAVTGGTGAGGTVRPRPYFVPLLQQVLGVPSSPGLTPPLLCPPPDQSQPLLKPASALPTPSPYTEQPGGLTERREPAFCLASLVRTGRRVPCSRPPPVPGTHAMAPRPSSVPLRIPLPPPPASSLLAILDPESNRARAANPTLVEFAAACRLDYTTALVAESESASLLFVRGECALGTDVLEDRQEDFECLVAAVPRFASMLLAPEGDPDATDIPTPRSYAEAITGTYVDEVPPPGANIVDGMWIFKVKRPLGSPPAFKARYVARGFSQRQRVNYFQTFSPTPKMITLRVLLHVAAQRDYELHSLDFSTAFLQGSLHEEIWLRRPPGFTGSFPAGTQWSLRRPVYGLRQAPREWHDTLRTTIAALGFTPTADPSLFLRTDTSLPPFYIFVYINNLVFANASTEEVTLVKSELQKRHSCTDLGPSALWLPVLLATAHSSVYQPLALSSTFERVPYPLSLLARFVAPGRHRKVHWDVAKRVLHYLCSTSSMGLVLGGRGPVVLIGHADATWVDESATQQTSQGYTFSLGSGSVSWRSTRSSSVLRSGSEAEIYAGAMAARELCWLTYLLTDLGEQPRSPPVLYVDNKAMIALCQEHRLEHRAKHVALRYFLARDLH